MKVKFVKNLFDYDPADVDLILGNVYEVAVDGEPCSDGFVYVIDDKGEVNSLFIGEYEVVNEA